MAIHWNPKDIFSLRVTQVDSAMVKHSLFKGIQMEFQALVE